MNRKIYVINPNSLQAVTDGIDEALEPLRIAGGPEIECLTLIDGPPGIQTQQDVDSVVAPLIRQVTSLEATASAFVIACFSDPGLHSLREVTAKPVIGISEAGMLTALMLGQRIGVIATGAQSVPRHLRYFASMGVLDRLAGELPVNLDIAKLADREQTLERMTVVGKVLRTAHSADVLVMGCAGMAALRTRLQAAVGIPVVEPCQAAVTMAIGRVLLNWHLA